MPSCCLLLRLSHCRQFELLTYPREELVDFQSSRRCRIRLLGCFAGDRGGHIRCALVKEDWQNRNAVIGRQGLPDILFNPGGTDAHTVKKYMRCLLGEPAQIQCPFECPEIKSAPSKWDKNAVG